MTKVLTNLMLELNKVRMKPSNVGKKNKETTKFDKNTVIYDVRTAHYENKTNMRIWELNIKGCLLVAPYPLK